jgi:hypothetical protein
MIMAREIVVHCDVDMRTGARVAGATYTLDLGRGPREIDLCEAHAKELVTPLQLVVDDLGSKPITPTAPQAGRRSGAATATSLDRLVTSDARHGKPPAGERSEPCPFCPLDYTTMTSIVTHCRNKHGFDPKATTADIFGRTCPICGAGGYDMLSTHAQHTHELGSVARLFAAAAAAGDEHGIVAERTALAENVMPS